MPEMNLSQITAKLNAEFAAPARQLIFWYDENAEFAEEVDALPLQNAKVYHLERDNEFYTKYFLECVDTTTNYLLYAPFAKPALADTHLADMLLYSKEFFADRASLIALDFGMDESCKPTLQKHAKFFNSKARLQRFADLELDAYTPASIETGIICVLCRCKTPSFEDVARAVLLDDWQAAPLLAELARYDVQEAFWQRVARLFGYVDAEPSVEKWAMSLFATCTAKTTGGAVPPAWQPYVTGKSGTALAFLDELMNSVVYSARFDEISAAVYELLGGDAAFNFIPADALAECGLFAAADVRIVEWLLGRLAAEDVGAKLGGHTLREVCAVRRRLHYGRRFMNEYAALEAALPMLEMGAYTPTAGADNLVRRYTAQLYLYDTAYRQFYYYFDKLDDVRFEALRALVEKIYTNDFLTPLAVNWNTELCAAGGDTKQPKQWEFYANNLRWAKERTVVIISDAMRYEVGQQLFEKLSADPKCRATITAMQSTLPSYTRLGMAALLPHRVLTLLENGNAECDGLPTLDLKQRETVLKAARPASRCVQFDAVRAMSVAELRELFTGQEVVYIYHNQIDARGDKPASENEVFNACAEAVDEIFALIKRLTVSANTVHYIVTADHGFLYKRDKLNESDKISGIPNAAKRYAVAAGECAAEGVCSLPLEDTMGGQPDGRRVYFALGCDLFKAAGSGLNYVHGGSSPQELLIPLIDVHTEKAKREVTNAVLALVSRASRITNLITTCDFVQTEPVSDVVKPAQYKLRFVDDAGKAISNEVYYTADSTEKDAAKRIFKLKFSFKNQKYDTARKYYLVANEAATGLEILRHEVMMDIAFADDFGFGF